ncbi:hypothetical protein ACLB2K_006920 [Fragaria x ananassa]
MKSPRRGHLASPSCTCAEPSCLAFMYNYAREVISLRLHVHAEPSRLAFMYVRGAISLRLHVRVRSHLISPSCTSKHAKSFRLAFIYFYAKSSSPSNSTI